MKDIGDFGMPYKEECLIKAEGLAILLMDNDNRADALRVADILRSDQSDFQKIFSLRFLLLEIERTAQFKDGLQYDVHELIACMDKQIDHLMTAETTETRQ